MPLNIVSVGRSVYVGQAGQCMKVRQVSVCRSLPSVYVGQVSVCRSGRCMQDRSVYVG